MEKKIVSARIDPQIADAFETVCDNLKIKKSTVMQELFKDFIVRNISKESHENAEIVPRRIKEIDED